MRRHSLGQSLVEFAVLSPLLLLLVMGMLDLGRAFYFEVVSTDAARDAARYASGYAPAAWPPAGPGQSAICDMAKADLGNHVSSVSCVYTTSMPADGRPYYGSTYSTGLMPGEAVVVIACPAGTSNCAGTSGTTVNQNVAVTVYYRLSLVTPGMSSLFGDGLTFQNFAVMRSLW